MKHLLKPVDAMKLGGTATIALRYGGYATGIVVECPWWPFAWPLVFERRASTIYICDPVSGFIVMWCVKSTLDQAIKDAAANWANRNGNLVDLTRIIFA